MLSDIGRLLVIFGIVVVVIGVVMMFADRIPFLGRLPGDIVVRRKNFTLYFPLVTMLIISVVLTILLNLFSRK
jgi:hypothetical protein